MNAIQQAANVDLIERCLIPGNPLLIIAPHGCGKAYLAEKALKRVGLGWFHIVCNVVDLQDLVGLPVPDGRGGFEMKGGYLASSFATGRALVFSEVDNLSSNLVDTLRHYLATTSRTIVLLAADLKRVPDDIVSNAHVLSLEWS